MKKELTGEKSKSGWGPMIEIELKQPIVVSLDELVDDFSREFMWFMGDIERKYGKKSRKWKYYQMADESFDRAIKYLKKAKVADRLRPYRDESEYQ